MKSIFSNEKYSRQWCAMKSGVHCSAPSIPLPSTLTPFAPLVPCYPLLPCYPLFPCSSTPHAIARNKKSRKLFPHSPFFFFLMYKALWICMKAVVPFDILCILQCSQSKKIKKQTNKQTNTIITHILRCPCFFRYSSHLFLAVLGHVTGTKF